MGHPPLTQSRLVNYKFMMASTLGAAHKINKLFPMLLLYTNYKFMMASTLGAAFKINKL